ncbi:Lrp/AsnC family transcriptional regulator [Flagellimonas myxillae]|uniref:Lrp/AsnC family transcriptional regulator n=1 Tax=Flagellimonas myxillae TaxID=2942214 RepID=UPI00201F7A9D|nr:Lrp/AsnC family transcriptional regulator [Muricauda myxillae]MCL6267874.1 Lrp/AsnC family transcriptional regulator [Muricauda myxillae]
MLTVKIIEGFMDKLDSTDITILRILQKDSKRTAKEIAANLNLTVSPVYERIRRLEKQGYIRKYVALLDKNRVGLPVTAFCQVAMRFHESSFIEKFEEQIRNIEEVQECFHMAGKVDFFLKINTESLEAYHDFVKYKLSKLENIGELNSTFVLKEIKHTSEFDI